MTDKSLAELIAERDALAGRIISLPTAESRPRVAQNFFTESGRLIPMRVHDALKAERDLRVGANGELYQYVDGFYRHDPESWARERIKQLLQSNTRAQHLAEVVTLLKAEPVTEFDAPDPRYLNLTNGLVDLKTGKLIAHTPDIPSVVRIPTAWNLEATCPRSTSSWLTCCRPMLSSSCLRSSAIASTPRTRCRKRFFFWARVAPARERSSTSSRLLSV